MVMHLNRLFSDNYGGFSGDINEPLAVVDQTIALNANKRKPYGNCEECKQDVKKRVTWEPNTTLRKPLVCSATRNITGMPSMVHWLTPLKFLLHPQWLVTNGSESLEVGVQQERELGHLETVYACVSFIPLSPAELSEVSEACDNSSIPEIRLVPIEDDSEYEGDEDKQTRVQNGTVGLPTAGDLDGVTDPDIAKAVTAALMLVKDPEVSNLVDKDLLIKLLKNPPLLENLVATIDSTTMQHKVRENLTLPLHTSIVSRSHPVNLVQNIGEAHPLPSENREWVGQCDEMPQPPAFPEKGVGVDSTGSHGREHASVLLASTGELSTRRYKTGDPINSLAYQGGEGAPLELCKPDKLPSSQVPLSNSGPSGTVGFHMAQTSKIKLDPHSPVDCEKIQTAFMQASSVMSMDRSQKQMSLRHHVARSESVLQMRKKSETRRQCIFFNSYRGCCKGASCEFLHQRAMPGFEAQ